MEGPLFLNRYNKRKRKVDVTKARPGHGFLCLFSLHAFVLSRTPESRAFLCTVVFYHPIMLWPNLPFLLSMHCCVITLFGAWNGQKRSETSFETDEFQAVLLSDYKTSAVS